MLVRIGKIYDLVLPSIAQYDEVHQDMFWYLLEQTRVNRFVGKTSLREFLIRYFLISNKSIDQTAEEFINEGLLFSGTIGGKSFRFGMQDLFHFIGFGCSDINYHMRTPLEEFITAYTNNNYVVTIRPDEENGVTSISKDTFILAMSGISTLLKIDSLDLEFREDLSGVQPEEIARVCTFVDYVIQQIPSVFFDEYQATYEKELKSYSEIYVEKEVVDFNPFTQMPKADLIAIFEHIIQEDYESFVEFRTKDEVDEDVIEDLRYFTAFVRFAYGVKHGYVDLNDNWYAFKSYSDEFSLDPLEELAGEDSEMYSTNYIYKSWGMDQWIHLVP